MNDLAVQTKVILTHDIANKIHDEILFKTGTAFVKDGIISAGAQSFAVIK